MRTRYTEIAPNLDLCSAREIFVISGHGPSSVLSCTLAKITRGPIPELPVPVMGPVAQAYKLYLSTIRTHAERTSDSKALRHHASALFRRIAASSPPTAPAPSSDLSASIMEDPRVTLSKDYAFLVNAVHSHRVSSVFSHFPFTPRWLIIVQLWLGNIDNIAAYSS